MKVKSEREVAQSCPTLSNPMDCSPPDFSIHGIFQAKVLEWGAIGVVAISFSSCKQIIIFKNVSGVSWQHSGKNPPASARDMGLIPDP